MHCNPHLYEINTRPFLRRLSERYQQPLTLTTIPQKEWQRLAQVGFDIVWLMGVWERSHGSKKEASIDSSLCKEYAKVLPDWTEDDIGGSPYAIHSYSLDPALGKPDELAELKSRLNCEGISLMLDFVPNHLALDHQWTFSHPERFVQGTQTDVRNHPDWFYSPDGRTYLAHGRDPYFPPWTDTAQVNIFSTDLRQALIAELLRIAELADGVRCDMAMLVLNDIFKQVWGPVIKDYPRPQTEFWTEAISRIKQKKPDFLFLAEAYWGLERKLQELGFDFTYDKVLYDRLRLSTPAEIRSHLMSNNQYHHRSAHFIENHDEKRAISALGRERSQAAAVVIATIPGLRFFHDGQLEGRRLRLPVQLIREPKEDTETPVWQFYERLLAVCKSVSFHDGEWQLITTGPAREGNGSHENLLAWSWQYAARLKVIVVNYSSNPAQGWLRLPPYHNSPENIVFHDELTGVTHSRDPKELGTQGLYVDLNPWQAHIFDTQPVPAQS